MDNFERVSDTVRRRLESHLSVFQTLSKRSRLLIRTCLASRSNPFSLSFEHILASRSNVLGFLFEHVLYNNRTHPGCESNAFIHGVNELGQKCVIPCA